MHQIAEVMNEAEQHKIPVAVDHLNNNISVFRPSQISPDEVLRTRTNVNKVSPRGQSFV